MKAPRAAGNVLIITLTDDVHVPFVTRHLGSDIILVDPARILDGHELSFSYDGHSSTVIYDGQPLTNIKSVWYRRPYIPEREDLKVPPDYKDYSYTSVRRHILNLYGVFQDAFWLSDYYTLLKAETKPRQLEVAAQLGFQIPRTLATSDRKAAAAFLANNNEAIVKSMASTLPIVNQKVHHFYTTKISDASRINLQGLHLGPAIFQAAVDVALGLRVTVVDDQVFAAAVRDQKHGDHPAIIDWRRNYTSGKTRFKAYDLPPMLQARCVALTKALNLRFGAIDLLLDTKGKYWFLEINPNGQWAFIEDDTDLPIGKAIARLLDNAGA